MATHPEFNEMTTNDEAARAFSKEIHQKAVLVTGVGPKGLGEALAVSIASQKPALLILASRTKQRLEAVSAVITARYPDVPVSVLVVDFSSQISVRSAAEEVSKITTKIHTLINNAGVVVPELLHTKDGIELQFGTNHIGPWLFTNLLLDQLQQAAKDSIPGSVRVVNVSSGGHRASPVRFSDYNFEGHELPDSEKPPPNLPPMFAPKDGEAYSGIISYGQSKTANVLTSVYLTQHLQRQGIVSYAVHPGSIWTELSRHLDEEAQDAIKTTGNYWKPLSQGAPPMLVAAFDPALNDPPGVYLNECQMGEAAPHATDTEAAARLWHLSEHLVDQKFDFDESNTQVKDRGKL